MSQSNGISEAVLRSVVSEVVGQLKQSAPAAPAVVSASSKTGAFGVYEDVADAAAAARGAFEQLQKKGWAGRKVVVDIVKTLCEKNAKEWGKIEFDETKIGKLQHKIEKLQGIRNVLGVEALTPLGMSGDLGITMEESAPWGVIGAITPVTHSVPTIAGNIVNMVAAGNALVVNPHPGGADCAAHAVRAFNQAIHAELGIENLISIVRKPTLDSFNALCKSDDVAMLCITGGPAVVNAAMQSGKRSICAGPGNPPVVVDESADLDRAAEAIILGGGYDNNLLCIGEKQVFVVEKVFDPFMAAMKRAGSVQLNSQALDRLTAEAFTYKEDGGGCSHPVLNRDVVGMDAAVLAKMAGASAPADCPMLMAETDANHAYVIEEQMMPVMPIVRVKDIGAAIQAAKVSEHGYRHSAMIHTRNVEAMTRMGREMDTTLFVKNGASVAGLGIGGEGYISFSIATTTGEGITTPRTFTRFRRCTLVEQLNIV